jgi:hypothetical protein
MKARTFVGPVQRVTSKPSRSHDKRSDRNRNCSPAGRTVSGLVQLGRYPLVWPQSRRSPVPYVAIGLTDQHLRQCSVRRLAL